MVWSLVQTVPPAAPAVDLAEAKAWLRVEHAADDALVARLVASATRRVEGLAGRQLVTATWRASCDRFPASGVLRLPRNPVQAVTALSYYDPDGALQTVDPSVYDVDLDADPALVSLGQYQVWPYPRLRPGAVRVTFTAGYGATAAGVPDYWREVVLFLVARRYARRGDDDARGEEADDLALRRLLASEWNGELYGGAEPAFCAGHHAHAEGGW